MQANVSADDIARFDALADRWWDPHGPMRPLHRMNPARIGWIHARIRERFGGAAVRVLDVGCGAGLASEALARRGLLVSGLDPAVELVEAARRHAAGRELPVAYRVGEPETLLDEGAHFPVVTALEVIEHVPDPLAFLRTLGKLTEPDGLLFVSTLSRTARSFLAAKVGAEYLLRLLPVGTHDWRKFITPAELGSALRAAGYRMVDLTGMAVDPLTGRWRTGRQTAVNYLAMAERASRA